MENPEVLEETHSSAEEQYNMKPYSKRAMKRAEQLKQVASLPTNVRKRIQALKKLLVKTTDIDADFHKKVCELETKYEDERKSIFDQRCKIIIGQYEPTADECNFNDPDFSQQLAQALDEFNFGNDDNSPHDNIKGIPDFWVSVLKSTPLIEPFIKAYDEPVLKHLVDIRSRSETEPDMTFVLEFHFSKNEYFSDAVLTKTYYLKCTPDPENPFSFDGPEIYKCSGCKINWYDGKNITSKTVKKVKPSVNDRVPNKTVKVESFFNFFDPPECPEEESDALFDDINTILETDFEVGHYIKERIIPRAVLFYTGQNDDLSDTYSSEANTESDFCGVSDEEGVDMVPQEGHGIYNT